MTDKIRIRTYNVRFGDAILVTIPDRDSGTGQTTTRNILIDVGNAPSGPGGDNSVFKPVVEDIIKELQGRPLDLYVMTHEHLDHVQGLYYAETKENICVKNELNTAYAWLTASAETGYYDKYPRAKEKKKLYESCYVALQKHIHVLGQESDLVKTFIGINDPRSTDECVDYLRRLARKTAYVYRGVDLAGTHPFKEAAFEILAPEEDTSGYYRSLTPTGVAASDMLQPGEDNERSYPPPAGVDAGAFYDLVEWRRSGFADNILAIDKAANNTSVVFSIEWRKKRLLFCGDAELASWKKMHEQGLLRPVDYLKVSHHGSHNGTPNDNILDCVMPGTKSKAKGRQAAICVWEKTYSGIPHEPTNERLRSRCKLSTTLDDPKLSYFDIEISEG